MSESESFQSVKWIHHTSILKKLTLIKINLLLQIFQKKTKQKRFNKENEYGVTGLTINSILPDEKIIKIENVKEQKRISDEIQELIKNYKEPDLTFFISHPETNTITIPFVKKNESDLPKLKLSYFNTSSKKNEDFLMYDYVGHLKKFGFEWNHNALGFKFEIKIDGKKI